jgi:SAM-dependent methyltransferase
MQRENISPELRNLLKSFDRGQIVLNEAEFGYRYVREHLEQLDAGARVLEVGSGPCVLLAQLKIDFPDLEVIGVEPIGPGFKRFQDTLRFLIEKYDFKLHKCGYEDLVDSRKFDFIFLVNVFEHLDDWRHFLEFIAQNLKENGKCIVLCPNYGFPYESHFKIPIVYNKGITYSLFKKRIEQHELENGSNGLWQSLNFVKWKEVNAFANESGLKIDYDTTILRQMIERLGHDQSFAERQRKISWLARLMLATGGVRLLETGPLMNFNPYLFLEISCRHEPLRED